MRRAASRMLSFFDGGLVLVKYPLGARHRASLSAYYLRHFASLLGYVKSEKVIYNFHKNVIIWV